MDIAFLIGRILFGGYFLVNAYNHIFNGGHMVGYATAKGVRSPKAAIFVSGLILLVGGLSILTGYMPLVGIIAVVLFLVPVTFKMHAYWKETDPHLRMSERVQFQKNIALIGATLMLLGLSVPWMFSL